VVNDRDEVLVVQEAAGPLRGSGVWKMCTGLVDAGEDVPAAAAREVHEETGVVAIPSTILALRQAHGFGAAAKSDLFFCVGLRTAPGAADAPLVLQADEIAAARWMPLAEYEALPFWESRPLWRAVARRCVAWARGTHIGLPIAKLGNGFNGRDDLLVCGPVEGEEEEEERGGG
jgi:8-oxo-dGTP pyrophosphatase MutT (NUDIX family)